MYLVLSVFFALDMIIMTAWSLINPFYPEIEIFPREKPDVIERDIEFLPQLEHCRSENLFIWYGMYFTYGKVRRPISWTYRQTSCNSIVRTVHSIGR